MLNNGLVLVGALLLIVAYVIYMRAERMLTNLPMKWFAGAVIAGGTCILVAGTGLVK